LGGTVKAAKLEGFGELRPITELATFDFRHLGDQAPIAAVEEVAYHRLLGFQTEPGAALPLGADAVIGDEFAAMRSAHDGGERANRIRGRTKMQKEARSGAN
jgi:hypothetical protein